jgi:hypothetical protein
MPGRSARHAQLVSERPSGPGGSAARRPQTAAADRLLPPHSQAEEPRLREQQTQQSKMQLPSRVPERAKIPEPQYEYTVTM